MQHTINKITVSSIEINPKDWLGRIPKKDDFDIKTSAYEETEIFCDGKLIAKYYPFFFSEEENFFISKNIEPFAVPTSNRGTAAGSKSSRRTTKSGYISSTTVSEKTPKSGILGYIDRGGGKRNPLCRMTSNTVEMFKNYQSLLGSFEKISALFQAAFPENFRAQKEHCDSAPIEYIIPNTVFTTVTVNKNFSTAYHTDKGDFDKGIGIIARFGNNNFSGSDLIIPKYKIAISTAPGSVLFFNVHDVHGNTPMTDMKFDSNRITAVLYARENIKKCLPFDEEIKRAKAISEPKW
jgi:hypothetical protein